MAKKEKSEPNAIKNWDLVVASLTKKLGATAFFSLEGINANVIKVDIIPTGLASLDAALGCFGIPKGRIIEIFGRESSSKTTLALQIISQFQKMDPSGPVVYVDLEHALEPTWIKRNGVTFQNVWIAQPDSAEDALNTVVAAAECGQVPLIVLDSVAALTSQAELEGAVGDNEMGKIGRLMGQFCRKVIGPLKKFNSTLICINQTRDKLGPYGGETRPGGAALKFFATQVLRVRKSGEIKHKDQIIGIDVEVEIKKNKVAAPFKVAIITLLFESGFSREFSLTDAAIEEGIVTKSASWLSFKDLTIQGREAFASHLASDRNLYDEIYNLFKSKKMSQITLVEQYPSEEEPIENDKEETNE